MDPIEFEGKTSVLHYHIDDCMFTDSKFFSDPDCHIGDSTFIDSNFFHVRDCHIGDCAFTDSDFFRVRDCHIVTVRLPIATFSAFQTDIL